MGKFDVEPLPKREGFVTVEILDYFDRSLPGEVVYMEETEFEKLKKDDKVKNKFEKVDKFKPKDDEK